MTISTPLVFALFLIAAPLFSAQTFAGTPKVPAYLAHGADPLQKVYSAALLGLAYEKKCQFLARSDRDSYEQRLNRINYFFEYYVLAQGMAKSAMEAVEYHKAMAKGARRFAASQPCDHVARKSVSQGFQLAKEFDEEIRKGSQQQGLNQKDS